MSKKAISISLIILLIISSAAGCSPQKSSTAAGSPESSSQSNPQDKTPPAEADMLVWNLGADPKTFDPGLNSTSDGDALISSIFEGLMQDTPEGVQLAAAESYEVSEDGLTYTFKIRDDAVWSDGQPLTSKDFEYSWKRACSPEVASEYANIITSYVKGAKEYFEKTGTKEEIAIKCPDDKTIQVTLCQPTPYFISLMSFFTYLPVRKDIVEQYGDGWERNPDTCIGNGPFRLTEYKIGSHYILQKNDKYWGSDSVKLNKLKILLIEDTVTSYNGYEAGEIQVLTNLPTEEIPRLKSEDPNYKTISSIGTFFVVFNVDIKPLDDVRVRKALSLAIDNNAVCEQVLKGGEIPATGIIPPILKYSDGTSCRKLDENGNVMEEFGKDPYSAQTEEAKAMLAEAGYPDGKGFPELTFSYNTNDSSKKLGQAFQEMWKQSLNIKVNLENKEWAIFYEDLNAGRTELGRGNWIGDYADPLTMMEYFTPESGNNYPQWRWKPNAGYPNDTIMNESNKPFDDAIKKSMTVMGEERDELLREAERIIMDERVVNPVFYYQRSYIVDEAKVSGVQRSSMGGWIFKNAELVK